MRKAKKTVQVSFRVAEEVAKALRRAANDRHDTMTAYCQATLFEDLIQKGYLRRPGPKPPPDEEQ